MTPAGGAATAITSGLGSTGDIYAELGVVPVINGACTALGGSLMYPEVIEAMCSSATKNVLIRKSRWKDGRALQDAGVAFRHLAKLGHLFSGRNFQIVDRDKFFVAETHGLDHFGIHQRAAECGIGAGAIDDRNHTKLRIDIARRAETRGNRGHATHPQAQCMALRPSEWRLLRFSHSTGHRGRHRTLTEKSDGSRQI